MALAEPAARFSLQSRRHAGAAAYRLGRGVFLSLIKRPPGWKVVAACEAGTLHVRQGKACEDAWLAATRRDGTLLLAVADGAGSAPRAAQGSQLAVEAVARAVSRCLSMPQGPLAWREFLLSVLREVRASFESAVDETLNLRDLATTLLFVVVTETWLAALQLGDGAIVIKDDEGNLSVLTMPHRGHYAGETVFVTSDDFLSAVRWALEPSEAVQGIALFTDGLEALALHLATLSPHAPFFEPLFTFANGNKGSAEKARELAAFLASERVTARTHDDKTLVLAVRS